MTASTATLWMGDLEPTMDEHFVQQAFTMMGEAPVNVKIIRNRMTGDGYIVIVPKGRGLRTDGHCDRSAL